MDRRCIELPHPDAQICPGSGQALAAWLDARVASAEPCAPAEPPAGDEWVLLSRTAYIELKSRCCRCGAPTASGTALEERLDRAARIAEVFERVESSGEGAAGPAAQPMLAWLSQHAVALRLALQNAERGRRAEAGCGTWVEAYANLSIGPFAAGAATLFDSGVVLTIDYGADKSTLLNCCSLLRAMRRIASPSLARAPYRGSSCS